MLHIRNTLHKHKYLENWTSNLRHRVLRLILHLEHLPLGEETAVYILNRGGGGGGGVPKITFCQSSYLF